ncbi:MAG TPA: ferritin-like domain-containing protein, partial [Chloroflexota bacterium]|nr:ferritin-like domain-containing protein [Chloroflexota bacterium]
CTFLTEVEFIAGDVPGKWVTQMPNDFYETKLFLSTQIMDEARHTDVFRKRALANGGGLLQQGPGSGLRNIMDAMDFTEMSVITHVVAEGFVLTLFRAGEWMAQNEAEKRIFRLAAQDESRHVAFGVMHLKYLAETQPERREEIHAYLDKAEGITAFSGLTNNPATSEALAILLGGGQENMEQGFERLELIRRRQINEYMHRLEVAGFGDRRERCHRGFQEVLEPPKKAARA